MMPMQSVAYRNANPPFCFGPTATGLSLARLPSSKLAAENGGVIKIAHSSRVIDRCLDEVAKDFGFVIERT